MKNESLEYCLARQWADNPEAFSSGDEDIYLADLLYYASDMSPIFVINVTFHAINLMDNPHDAIMPVYGPMLDILCDNPDSVEDLIFKLIDSHERFRWAISDLYSFRAHCQFIDKLFLSRDLESLINTDMPSCNSERGSH